MLLWTACQEQPKPYSQTIRCTQHIFSGNLSDLYFFIQPISIQSPSFFSLLSPSLCSSPTSSLTIFPKYQPLQLNLLGNPLPIILSKSIVHIIICTPSSLTFSILGKAATVQAVSDSYKRINLDGRRLFLRSGLAWIRLLHTSFCEFVIVFVLFGVMAACLSIVPKILFACGIRSEMLGLWGVLGCLGVPFCVAFANVMVVGNLARILSVMESECYGFQSLSKANSLIKGKRQTALVMALWSNMGLRLVEHLFDFRMCNGIGFWEGPVLVSMYASVLVFDTIMNAVFYFACKH